MPKVDFGNSNPFSSRYGTNGGAGSAAFGVVGSLTVYIVISDGGFGVAKLRAIRSKKKRKQRAERKINEFRYSVMEEGDTECTNVGTM
jgi:hypothetical protein